MLFGLVIALHCWLVWVGPFPGDHWALFEQYRWPARPAILRSLASLLAGLATPVPALAIAGLAALWLLWRGRPGELGGLVIACSATAACALLKTIYGPTPLWATFYPHSVNYPSGHVTFFMATIGYIGVCAHRHRWRGVAAGAVVLIVAIGPERVFSGVHLVSDVVAGYMLGASWLILAYMYSEARIARSRFRVGNARSIAQYE